MSLLNKSTDKYFSIGIFDSGIGGLIVAKAIHQLLSHESFLYVADILHILYGEKTPQEI